MEDQKFIRVKDDDPTRCQASTRNGQCNLKAVPNGKCCLVHGGAMALKNEEQKNLKNYRLAKFRVRITELGSSSYLISLTDEVGILRMLIEEMINSCVEPGDLMLRAGPLADLLMKSEKLVSSCHRLDSKLGNLLSKDQVMQFAQLVVEIISNEIDDEKTLDTISAHILKALGEI
ncbi:hypothetical protein LCGC14_2142650 [marine sediment metagenome]|uniref:Uncharacterized protein n=1 Tax=marine sediment metagenome TaxID=412755 RepID=A0A0F9DXW9_9ZZZZ